MASPPMKGSEHGTVESDLPEESSLSAVVPEVTAGSNAKDQEAARDEEENAEVIQVTVIDDFVKARRCTCWRLCLSCLCLFTVLVGCSLFFLWPREPDWKLVKLDLDPATFAFVMVSGGSEQLVKLTADVQFWNPNYVSSSVEPGTFKVYLGSDIIAWGETNATHTDPLASSFIRAYVTVGLNADVAAKILQEVSTNNMLLKVLAEVETFAHVLMFRIRLLVRCEVTSDTLKVMTPKPEETIIAKHCTYEYSL
eukprot:TRINITY_DN10837_c0_g1_i1.p1 TRINITY_DN10837_c0_g1~~TRINITY_DN10837_c0_g1_i1.p1  ORF type:complete len:268 (+),score=45.91 TRINITY_DN10837_c0_g1_i1:46-804(+)